MKRTIIVLIAIFALSIAANNGSVQAQTDFVDTTKVTEGDKAPSFTVEMLDGTKISSKELKGKVVLISFWATWCPPCRAELGRIEAELLDKIEDDNFIFLAISRGETKEKVEEFITKNSYKFNVGLDQNETIFKSFAENAIPRTYLIGKNGKIAKADVGFPGGDVPFAEMEKEIKKALQ